MADAHVAQYYDAFDEDSRLSSAFGQLEFARTMELLLRYLPPPPALVLDIGGGTGPYSEALGQQGYETHLLDPVAKHVERAKLREAVVSVVVGAAPNLDCPDKFAEAALILGPVYHLHEQSDLPSALQHEPHVLKPGSATGA